MELIGVERDVVVLGKVLGQQTDEADVLVDIQMSRYGGFDYDKSEKIIAIGRQKTMQALRKLNNI